MDKAMDTKDEVLEILNAIEACQSELTEKEKHIKTIKQKIKSLKTKLKTSVAKIGKSKSATKTKQPNPSRDA